MSEEEWDKVCHPPFHFSFNSDDNANAKQCWSANVKVPKALLAEAQATFNANPDGGHMITSGSIAVRIPFASIPPNADRSQALSQGGSSMPYAVTKAAQLQLVKCLAVNVGPRIRVNTVLPGLLLTEWVRYFLHLDLWQWKVDVYQGLKYSPERIEQLKSMAVLKHETYLQDCVDAFVMLAKNTSMTGMRIQVDAGLNVQGA